MRLKGSSKANTFNKTKLNLFMATMEVYKRVEDNHMVEVIPKP
jgi:hypothetical protein